MSSSGQQRASKNCGNCRAVKRRCDQKRPHCSQCIRLGLECVGYRDKWELVFRDQTSRTAKRVAEKSTKRSGHVIQPGSFPIFYRNGIVQSSKDFQRLPMPQQSSFPQDIALSAMNRNQLFAKYLNEYFPSKVKPHALLDSMYIVIPSIYALPQKVPMLEKACCALSCVFLGKINHDQALLKFGLQIYNHAIHEMSRAIGNKDMSDDIVYTCSLFGQIETHHCPDSLEQWYTHVDGLSTIMQYHRPQKIDSPIMASIYGPHQKLRVVFAKGADLTDPLIAWLKEPGEGFLHEMIQLCTDLSILYNSIHSVKTMDDATYQTLLDEWSAIANRQEKFYQDLNGGPEDPPTYSSGELQSKIPTTDTLFGPPYKFNSLNDANLYISIWVSMCYIHCLACEFQNAAKDYITTSKKVFPANSSPLLAGLYIFKTLRCLPYLAQQGMNSWAMNFAIPALSQASRMFIHGADRERFMWTQDVSEYCAKLGFHRADQLREIWRNLWVTANGDDTSKVVLTGVF